MEKRILGKDLAVSAVGLGCMGMTRVSGVPADVKEKKAFLRAVGNGTLNYYSADQESIRVRQSGMTFGG